MQHKIEEYKPEAHEAFKALSVKQPYASDLVLEAGWDDEGHTYGWKSIEVRSRPTKFRGDVLICSAAQPSLPDKICGATLGFVELYDVKPVSEFTAADWEVTRIPESERPRKGYGWMMRNPRRVIELPIKGQLGIFTLVMDAGDIVEYPQVIQLDHEAYAEMRKQWKNP